MEFTELIKQVHESKVLEPDLLKSETGNNFRAVSEAKILELLNPILDEAHWYYTIEVLNHDLQVKEAYGKNGKKLQFIATVRVKLTFDSMDFLAHEQCVMTEAVGMGIDDNDKAMGKAYTYAVKYALLKLFRLRFSDDPDFKASEPLLTEKAPKKEEPKEEKTPAKTVKKSKNEPLMSENQRDYILGLMKAKNIKEAKIIGKFHVEPSYDQEIPMKTARAIIEWLNEQEANIEDDDLPF